MENKEERLQLLSDDLEKTRRLQQMMQEKTKRDVEEVKKQLQRERTLKLDAFQCVSELRNEVCTVQIVSTFQLLL